MAYIIGKPTVHEIDCLPAAVSVTLKGKNLTGITAKLHDKCLDHCQNIDTTSDGAKISATIPESVACWGQGKYYVTFEQEGIQCAQCCVRFVAGCSKVSEQITVAPTRKARKKNG